MNDPKPPKYKHETELENIKRIDAGNRAFISLLVRAHNLPLVLSAISSIVSHEKNVEAPCPTYENIIQECSDSEFGIENIEFNPTNPNDTSVNVALDPNGLLRAGTHIKILEYITSHTPMKEKDDIFLESTEEFETRCFLHIYKELKTLDGNKLDADSLLRLLKQRNIHQNCMRQLRCIAPHFDTMVKDFLRQFLLGSSWAQLNSCPIRSKWLVRKVYIIWTNFSQNRLID